MGDKVEPRRKWIESHVQFSLEEDGSILEKKEETIPGLVEEKLQEAEQISAISLSED